MDDTNPEIVKAEAFKYFLDYCIAFGIRESQALFWDILENQLQLILMITSAYMPGRQNRLMQRGLIPIWRS